MSTRSALYALLAVIVTAVVAIYAASAPSLLKPAEDEAGSFSAANAYQYLQAITKAPHSTGTKENHRVREYIVNTCQQMGLPAEVQNAVPMSTYGGMVVANNVHNVIARLKGTSGGKAVLVLAHFDSQPNAYGAGDDGAGVAGMLETAHILASGKAPLHDIIFLFTDGEEDGLMGAKAFAADSARLKEIGVVLNFEGRGNRGISMMFETNPGNGWVIREFARGASHPFANSMNYEVYKSLPNNTDYSVFKEAGLPGLNSAFIEGFVNYHSMTDRAENLDMDSFQDQGDNMLSLTRHFANIVFDDKPSADTTYFNVIGDWMVRYPAGWNLVLLILGDALLIAQLGIGLVKKRLHFVGLLAGLFWFVVILAIIFFSSEFLLSRIRAFYPVYSNFYAANSYNAYCYFFALSAWGAVIFSLSYQWAIRQVKFHNLIAGIMLVEGLALNGLYLAAPSALYLLLFPLLSGMAGWCLYDRRPRLSILFVLPALLLLSPVIYFLYVAFGLTGASAAAVLILGLLAGFLLPVLQPVLHERRWLMPAGAFLLFAGGLVFAHTQSSYTDKRPLQTDLRYVLDTDKQKAYWVSDLSRRDMFTEQYLPHGADVVIPGRQGRNLVDDAPVIQLEAPMLKVLRDTTIEGVRRISVHCTAAAGTVSVRLVLGNGVCVGVGGRPAPASHPARSGPELNYIGIPDNGFDAEFESKDTSGGHFEIEAIGRTIGLEGVAGFKGYPENVIPGPGYQSNSVQVARRYSF